MTNSKTKEQLKIEDKKYLPPAAAWSVSHMSSTLWIFCCGFVKFKLDTEQAKFKIPYEIYDSLTLVHCAFECQRWIFWHVTFHLQFNT